MLEFRRNSLSLADFLSIAGLEFSEKRKKAVLAVFKYILLHKVECIYSLLHIETARVIKRRSKASLWQNWWTDLDTRTYATNVQSSSDDK